MDIRGFSQAYFPPLSVLRHQPTAAEAQAAKNRIATPAPASPPNSDVLTQSFYFVSRNVPTAELATPLDAFRLLADRNFLKNRVIATQIPLTNHLDASPQSSNNQTETLNRLRTALGNLQDAAGRLQQEDSLNTRSADSTYPTVVSAVAGKSSPATTVSVKPLRLSVNRTQVSDNQASPITPVGMSGSFVINGFQVNVESTDSIVDIKNKINRGEDLNGNGKLDGAEDANGNGQSDTLYVRAAPAGAGLYIVEDANANGKLDAAEDTNANGKLDGGTSASGIRASIEGNRLKLENITGAQGIIDLTDTSGILLKLGFFELNSKGLSIRKESQLSSDMQPINLNKEPQEAKITADNKPFSSPTNEFNSVIQDTTLTVRQASDITAVISIKFDPQNAADRIKTLFAAFNDAVNLVNTALEFSRTFTSDPDLQRLRDDLTDASRDQLPDITARNTAIDGIRAGHENQQEIGFAAQNTAKNTVSETAITSAVRDLKNGLTLPFKNAATNLFQRLSSIGLRTAADDTIAVDETALEQALKTNAGEVNDVLNHAETGILPQLQTHLERVLQEGLGTLDLKQMQLKALGGAPAILSQAFEKKIQVETTLTKYQRLIAVA
jgi:flagellar capping protein FliD